MKIILLDRNDDLVTRLILHRIIVCNTSDMVRHACKKDKTTDEHYKQLYHIWPGEQQKLSVCMIRTKDEKHNHH